MDGRLPDVGHLVRCPAGKRSGPASDLARLLRRHFPIHGATADGGIPIDERPLGRLARGVPDFAAQSAEFQFAIFALVADQFGQRGGVQIAEGKGAGKTVPERDDRAVGFENQRGDGFGERA